MKINAACGLDYRRGYLNIDMHDSTVADRLMPLWDMDLPDAEADEILARQALEHLGFFAAAHFLSESFRVLKPGGALIIETPDIETSFRSFGARDRAGREKLTQWIFGMETPGMAHLFCFPAELLEETVSRAGFSITRLERFAAAQDNPALRLTAVKVAERPALKFMAHLRREALRAGLCPFDSEPACADRETLFARFQTALENFYADKNTGHLAACMELSAENAELTYRFFLAAEKSYLLPGKYAACAARLTDERFRTETLLRITDLPLDPARQKDGINNARALVRAAAAGLLSGGDISDYLPARPRPDQPPEFDCAAITENTLKQQSVRLCAKGVKLAANGDAAGASERITAGLKLFRHNCMGWWNLARLARLDKNTALEETFFDHALQCLKLNPDWDRTGDIEQAILQDKAGKCINSIDGLVAVNL